MFLRETRANRRPWRRSKTVFGASRLCRSLYLMERRPFSNTPKLDIHSWNFVTCSFTQDLESSSKPGAVGIKSNSSRQVVATSAICLALGRSINGVKHEFSCLVDFIDYLSSFTYHAGANGKLFIVIFESSTPRNDQVTIRLAPTKATYVIARLRLRHKAP